MGGKCKEVAVLRQGWSLEAKVHEDKRARLGHVLSYFSRDKLTRSLICGNLYIPDETDRIFENDWGELSFTSVS